jgi:Mrp family chromosome partitioning ATPase
VTRFRREVLRAGQTVHVLARGDYWQAMRHQADVVIVDCPAADRSQAAVTIAPYMDETVLVVAADQADVKPPAILRDAVAAAGGAVSGLFFNRATVSPPGFLKGLIP